MKFLVCFTQSDIYLKRIKAALPTLTVEEHMEPDNELQFYAVWAALVISEVYA